MHVEGRLGKTWFDRQSGVCMKTLREPLLVEPYQGYFVEQTAILNALQHPALLKPQISESQPGIGVSFATPLMETNLEALIRGENPNVFTIHNKILILISIAHAIAYLHRNVIIHGNLHPRNILFSKEWKVMIADYGLNVFAKRSPAEVDAENGRATPFTPPEFINQTANDASADVFAFGSLMFQVLYSDKSWMDNNPYLLNLLIGGYYPFAFPEQPPFKDAEQLIKDCWKPKLGERPTFDAIVNRLYQAAQSIKGVDFNSIIKELQYYNSNSRETLPPTAPKYFNVMTFAANGGNPHAMLDYANVFLDGKCFQPYFPKAIYYLRKSANLGHAPACQALAIMLEAGRFVSQDLVEAYDLYEIASQNKDCKYSIYKFAYFLVNGIGGLKDVSRGFSVAQKGANEGDADCLNYLGELYENGLGTKADLKKAKEYYEKASKSNHAKGLYNQARVCEIDPKAKKRDAFTLYEKGANAGSPDCMNRLGELLLNPEGIRGVKANPERAMDLFNNAASKGCPKAMYNFALILNSKGNYQVASDYMKNAANLGCKEAVQYLESANRR